MCRSHNTQQDYLDFAEVLLCTKPQHFVGVVYAA